MATRPIAEDRTMPPARRRDHAIRPRVAALDKADTRCTDQWTASQLATEEPDARSGAGLAPPLTDHPPCSCSHVSDRLPYARQHALIPPQFHRPVSDPRVRVRAGNHYAGTQIVRQLEHNLANRKVQRY